jgi:adenylate cyclase
MSKRIPIFLGMILICLAIWVLITPSRFIRSLTERLDNLGYDLQLRTRVFTKHEKPLSPVAIVDIDDKSLQTEGHWPWPRSKLANLIDELQKQGAAVIAFDIFFAEKEPNMANEVLVTLKQKNKLNASVASMIEQNIPLFDEDTLFAQSLAHTQAVLALGFLPRNEAENILPPPLLTLTQQEQQQLSIIRARGYISNIPVLQQAAKGGGFINIFPDNDGIIRRAPLLINYEGKIYPSLSLQAVISFLGEKISLVTPTYGKTKKLESIKLGSLTIPTDDRGQVLIPFIGRSYTFSYYSATDILHNKLQKDALLGKILFIGTSATGLGDLQATSIQNPFPGVEIQATLVNGMLQHLFSYIPAWTLGANIFLTLLFGLFAAIFFPYLGPRILSIIIVLLPAAMLFINNWIWEKTGLILSFLIPVILVLALALFNMIYGYLFETRRREQLKIMFGQYVPEKHIDEMLKSSAKYVMHGEDREMSVMFSDIRNFTSISEGMAATDLVTMLNTFFTPMTEIIFKHRGTIDKYVGDLIMAFWGAPLRDKNHRRHAIESALEMQAKLKEIQPLLTANKWAEIKIGIGINSGEMSVGDMGSRFRRNYTVLGDSVNLASRVEGLTKFYGVDIIVTEATHQNQSRFVFRKLDQVRVKGKKQGIAIYEVICHEKEATPELQQELKVYHQALDFYFQQQWDNALTLLSTLKQRYPNKKIYSLYLERIEEFKSHPLPPDWDGIYVHTAK